MANLIYSTIVSLDGYVADKGGDFGWAAPEEEVHAFVNDLERKVGAFLCGRRMYEVMRYWETAHAVTDRLSSRTKRRYGGRPTRSCTRRRWKRSLAPGRGSSATSTPKQSVG